MLEGSEVTKYFNEHPEAKETVESIEAQFECWRPELTHEQMYRKLKVEDIRFISYGGWFGEPGVFAWYYPGGVPHYTKIADE